MAERGCTDLREPTYPPDNALAGPSSGSSRGVGDVCVQEESTGPRILDEPLSESSPQDAASEGGSQAIPDTEESDGPSQSAGEQEESSQVDYPALEIRRTVFRRCLQGLTQLGGRKRWALIAKGLLIIAEVIAFIVVLGITSSQACDTPLRTFLALYVVRVFLSYPMAFYNTLAPRRPTRRQERNDPESGARAEALRVLGSRQWDDRIRFAADVMAAFALVLFVVSLFATTHLCLTQAGTSPTLYWSSLVALLFGFVYALEIALILIGVLFFLPLAILFLRVFGVGAKKHEIGPLTQPEIEKIPLVLFVPQLSSTTQVDPGVHTSSDRTDHGTADIELAQVGMTATSAESSSSAPQVQIPSPPQRQASTSSSNKSQRPAPSKKKRRRHLLRLFRKTKAARPAGDAGHETSNPSDIDLSRYVKGPHPFKALPENLSTCPICLCDFEVPPLVSETSQDEANTYEWEPLRLLPCQHVLHKGCLDPWLLTSGRCPICQHPVKPQNSKRKSGTPATQRNVSQTNQQNSVTPNNA